MEGVRTTCPYCGVGCGVVAQPDGRIVGDTAHPANFGRLCSKGAALAETLDDRLRLRHPMVDGIRADWDTALGRVADTFRATIAAHGSDSVAFYVSGQCLTEDYYVANKLMKGFIGSGNIDTNSRLCMASTVAGHSRAFGADIVPGTYADLDTADLVVLVGSNLAWCHPVLFQRLQAARAARGTRIVVVDPRRTATCEDADLHLQLAPGSDVALFAGLLDHLDRSGAVDRAWVAAHASGLEAAVAAAREVDVAAATGLAEADLARFYAWFAETPRTVTVFSQGVNQSTAGTDKVNAIINVHLATGRIGTPGAGPFSVTGQPNAMGGREVGGLANQLAAHMRFEQPGALDRVQRFWRAPRLASGPGLKAVDLFEAVRDGRVKAIWIVCTNPADSMPRVDRVRAALAACPFVVVSDIWPTDTTRLADVVLPAAGWGERDGTVTNSERRISRQRAFRDAPGEARADWWMLAQVGQRMGWRDDFAWPGAAAIFREHAALTAFENDGTRVLDLGGLAGLSDDQYDALPPRQWPVPAAGAEGGPLFAEGGFPTPDGRARLVPTRWRPLDAAAGFPLLLNTGRVRDQWHTMTRTGLVPRLMQHVAEPLASLHPEDAAALGVTERGLVRLETAHGEAVLRARLEAGQRRGEVFVPMHWSDSFASAGPIGRLVGDACDPVSGQPELKATPLRASAVALAWRGLLLQAEAKAPVGAIWSRIPLAQGHAYDLSGADKLPAEPAVLARQLMGAEEADLVDMADPARGVWRYALFREGRLRSCLYLTSGAATLPSHQALAALLAAPVADAARSSVLAGGGAGGGSAERLVCACFAVGLDTVREAVAGQRLASVAEIGRALRAGTNCGSCIPELKEILRDHLVPAA
ncbi:MAG: nitrate reductase [Acetobacteraceae bacterium]